MTCVICSESCVFVVGRELEGVNNLSSQILRRCFPTNKLPVSTLSSPLAFALLDLDSAGHSAVEDLLDDSGEGDFKCFFPITTLTSVILFVKPLLMDAFH